MAEHGTVEAQFRVTRDGNPLTEPMSENGCFMWIQKHQGMSVDWAMKYEGYAIVPVG